MGDGLVINCKNCSYTENIFVGVGEAYSDIDNVLSMVKGRNQRQITEILNNHDVKHRNFYKALYVCAGCGTFYNRLYVQIIYDNQKEFITNYICDECEDELHKIDDYSNIAKYSCPKCKKKSLSANMDILWD